MGASRSWPGSAASSDVRSDAVGQAQIAFRGEHQAGVSTPPQAFATFLAFDLRPEVDRDALIRLMAIWTEDIERLTQGTAALADTEPELATAPARLTVTLGFGPQVFTAAGIEDRRPPWLAPLPALPIDRLHDAWSGGDVVLQVGADDPMALAHAARVLTKGSSSFLTRRWTQQGFREAVGARPDGTTMRNLMGQVDGTVNPDPSTDPELIWYDAASEPWLAGATSMVVRRIALDLDAWDKVDRAGREFTIGRTLDTGAPITGGVESDPVDLEAVDSLGLPVVDLAAHTRRARALTPHERFLRRGYNFHDPGQPAAETSGLIFVTFQRDVTAQYLPVQLRLSELDLLNQWSTPIGSAVFFVPAGAREGQQLAEQLLL